MTDIASMFSIAMLSIALAFFLGGWVLLIGRQRDRLDTAHVAALKRIGELSAELEDANGRAADHEHRGHALYRHNCQLHQRALQALAERDDAVGALEQARQWNVVPLRANRRLPS